MVFLLGTGAYAAGEEQARSITVTGTGFASVEPDRATLTMAIVARRPTLAAAQEAAADVVIQVLNMTDRMNIARDRVDTTGASVRPNYRWSQRQEAQELLGYIAERQVAIVVDDLETLGALIEGSVEAGVNQVSPPQLDSIKRKAAYRRALRVAAEDANANALQLAETLGAGLGRVISVSSDSLAPRPAARSGFNLRAMAAESDAVASYNAADLSFNATVTVTFELTD